MSDFRYLPFPLPADATLTLTTTITRDPSTPIPTATTSPSISTTSLQDPSQILSITTITLRVTDAPSNSSSILSTAVSSSPTPTPTPTPSGPAHKPAVRGDITPTFYILALVPILVMILCAYESYTHRKIDAKQKNVTTTTNRAAAPRNHPNGDIELQDLSTAPAAPLRQYWWFEDDTVTNQVSTDTDDRGVPYNSLCHPRPPIPLPSLWTASWWPYSRGSGQGRPHGTLPGWGRRHTFSECGSYPSTFDPSRPRLGLKFEPLTQEATDTAPAAAETNLVPSRPSTPDWAAGIPSYYNNGRSPTLNYSSSVSSCSSTSVADVDMIPPGMSARAAGKLPAKP
ncbi:hypothetical protein CGMCC3_g11247 [Colletotrichum fructicola]|uniref:Uncharacterized protein n=1 Tax=Colletotrichum fructicola (strain Nara gc5) TaxID=1213859 RepID=A0A7J6JFW9_COLFN|nr:uncharacterized protein CGMCC3_g11247 [Colletotrichum fructicola]KAE9572705.1 hypothetical protein CGMCC3_g11247 [Colletotrichum fructicola]KAF4411981.1 hypothetical protein CFRS1_v001715 [Colletotrichum fructicola]KAF4489217.1 hypothetical protein CGGC5_v003200 [Colletotrichum fructicola Nara gc5]